MIRTYIIKWNAKNRVEFAGFGRASRQTDEDKREEREFLKRFPTFYVDSLTNAITDQDTPANLCTIQEIIDHLCRNHQTMKNVTVAMGSDQFATYWTLMIKENHKT